VGGVVIILFNPLATTPGKQPLPLAVLSLAAALGARSPWRLVDGNIEPDPARRILEIAAANAAVEPAILAVTAMPGPQLRQAVAVCERVRAARPEITIVWGGYFATQHTETVLRSPLVDFVIRSQGERPFLELVDTLRHGGSLSRIGSLSWKRGDEIVHNPLGPLTVLDELPDLPYADVPMTHYVHGNYLGRRTVAHNSSFGCPFACNFCAVGAMAQRRWLAQSAARTAAVVEHLAGRYGVDAVQMNDMDFFISEGRTQEFSDRIAPLGVNWWGLGRVDVLMSYSDSTWRAMQRSGLKMIFSGAESGSEAKLAAMDKGGKASPALTLDLARRMREYGIIPEFSFVLGCPPDPLADLTTTFDFIRRLKQVNPLAEVILYTYTPVPFEGTLFADARREHFAFPETLAEWADPQWEQFALRRGDGVPWGRRTVQRRIRNFERVLNASHPTATDLSLAGWRRAVLKAAGGWRYALKFYDAPIELRALQRLIPYQRPETTGF
jgi:anaerobic magnesium-protoporphyrin IX monomethyl ester cyclase